jgi:DNA-binding GntR family transcriptional regulator
MSTNGPLPSRPRTPAGSVLAAPLADQVFEILRGWIMTGELPPDHRLRVRDLAEMVGTSVMPVRDAIRRLVESGLVVHEPYKGARVRALDTHELENAYDARILLEGECARLGTLARDAGVADRMHEHWIALDEAARSGEILVALQKDEDLLDELYAASGNDVLIDIVHGLWDQCRPYKVLWADGTGDPGDVSHWHHKAELVDAVRNNDASRAEEIVRESYRSARDSLRTRLPAGEPSE